MQQSFLDQKHLRFEEEESSFLDFADKGLGDSLEDGLETAAKYAQVFVSMEEGSSLGFAKFLHGVNFRWAEFEKEKGDTFQRWAVRSTGRAVATIQRRICVWEWLSGNYIPSEYKDAINSFSIKMLSRAYKISVRHKNNKRVGNYDFEASQYEMENGDWLALSECVDEAMLTDVLDKITGKEPNSNRMSFKIDDTGSIWFYMGKNSATIGQLSLGSESQIVRDGIAELMERASITEKSDY